MGMEHQSVRMEIHIPVIFKTVNLMEKESVPGPMVIDTPEDGLKDWQRDMVILHIPTDFHSEEWLIKIPLALSDIILIQMVALIPLKDLEPTEPRAMSVATVRTALEPWYLITACILEIFQMAQETAVVNIFGIQVIITQAIGKIIL